MLQLFRTNQFAANILLIFYVAILHISSFIIKIDWTPLNKGIWSDAIYSWIGASGIGANILAIILVFIQAFLINVIVARYRMAREVTLLPGLCYILIASYIPEFLYLSPVLMANTFAIIALMNLFETYKKPSSAGNIFNVGIWIGISSLFYFSYLSFFLLAFFGLNILRAFKFRELLMLLLGIITPYFLSATYFFLNNTIHLFWQTQVINNLGFLSFIEVNHWIVYVKLAFFAILVLICILSINQYMMKKNIRVHKNLSILYWVMVTAAIALLIQQNVGLEHLLILAIPLGILISFSIMNLKNQTAEAIHFMLLFGAFVFQFQTYLMP